MIGLCGSPPLSLGLDRGGPTSPRGSIAVKLDRIDIRILHELQKNGRITNVELASSSISRRAPA